MATDGDLQNPKTTSFARRKYIRFSCDFEGDIAFIELVRCTADESQIEVLKTITIQKGQGGGAWPSLFNDLCGVASGGPATFRQRLRDHMQANYPNDIG